MVNPIEELADVHLLKVKAPIRTAIGIKAGVLFNAPILLHEIKQALGRCVRSSPLNAGKGILNVALDKGGVNHPVDSPLHHPVDECLPHDQPIHRIVNHSLVVFARLIGHIPQFSLQIVQVILQIRAELKNLWSKAFAPPGLQVCLI